MRPLLSLLLLLLPLAAAADYSTHPRAAELLQRLQDDYGFSQADLSPVVNALRSAQQLPQLIEQEQKAPEKTETWTQYSRRIDEARVRDGVTLLREQQDTLARAEFEYGVPAAVIAAILGVETRYGRVTGKVRVLDALATQGFDHPTRSKFFFGELAEFFALCRERALDPCELKGSYAGAMGDAQFMPSNYRRLALDFDGDGHRDLWSLPDAIGSVANYFTHYSPDWRWRRGEPLIVPARLKAATLPAQLRVNSREAFYRVDELQAAGLLAEVALPQQLAVGVIELPLDGDGREYYLALPNFYVVMTYNPRIFYAMAVAQLAQKISAAYAAATP